jgi:hypothetical protein
MRRRATLLAAALAFVLAAAAVGVAIASRDEPVPRTPVPRVCWFSDYENARLSNKCEFREDDRRWYMEVDGRTVPADTQKLPPANLCHYFAGTECPKR